MAVEKKFTCIGECREKFGVGEWECMPGIYHTVEMKTYYTADAPFMSKADKEKDPDGVMLRSSRNRLEVIPDRISRSEDGQIVRHHYAPLEFIMGKFETSNPMEQYYLEQSKFPVSYDRWFAVYHTPTQKANIEKNTLLAERQEVAQGRAANQQRERELNDLLAKAKENVSKGKPASA